jgi:deazaflavin-dependent oxidoreductase (nitroreductase family)
LGLDDHNGTRVIEAQGRRSGVWRSTPVRVLDLNEHQYVVAMYGESNWARNLRSQRLGRIRRGKHLDEFRAVEIGGRDKLPILRAYFKRWWNLVSGMTIVTSPDAPEEEIAKAAPFHPVFRLDFNEKVGD